MKSTYKSSSNTTYRSSSNTILKGQQPSSTEMRQMEERLQRLESAHDRPSRGRRWNQRRESRSYHQYGVRIYGLNKRGGELFYQRFSQILASE